MDKIFTPELNEQERIIVEAFGMDRPELLFGDLVTMLRDRADAVENTPTTAGRFDQVADNFEATGFSRVKVARAAAYLIEALTGAELNRDAAFALDILTHEINRSIKNDGTL